MLQPEQPKISDTLDLVASAMNTVTRNNRYSFQDTEYRYVSIKVLPTLTKLQDTQSATESYIPFNYDLMVNFAPIGMLNMYLNLPLPDTFLSVIQWQPSNCCFTFKPANPTNEIFLVVEIFAVPYLGPALNSLGSGH